MDNLGRRRLLTGAGAAGATAFLAACTSNAESSAPAAGGQTTAVATDNAPGKPITIGFSAPEADHGWIGAITSNAKSQAGKYSEVTLDAVEGTNDVNQQISQVETLIDKKVDAIVLLPFDGKALTETGLKAQLAGIPVVNLDRVFADPRAARTWIGGDNYGMGAAAGTYIADQMKSKGISEPVIAEIQGIANLPLTQERSQGFADALGEAGFKVTNQVSAEFTVESGQQVTADLLQAAPHIDALWNHDDDQGVGVMAAINQAGRDEFIMVGGAGSSNMMKLIKSDNSVIKATVTYPPSMASSAINLARLIANGRGMSDLVEPDVPASITLSSATVTKANVDQYLPLAFPS
ncbi:MAG: substrate-binding domain-containing protein [Nocardioides sp.]|nr:substrate-binding domain-containing protein [Nocardioides sp.]